MANNTRHKRMIGEREQRIKELKEIIKGHHQIQGLYIAYIHYLLDKLGAYDKDSGAMLKREEINARVSKNVLADFTESGDIILHIEREGEHGEEGRDSTEQG